MKRLKKGIFPFIIGFHIILRLLFSNTFTNDEIITDTSSIVPNDFVAQEPLENDEFAIKNSDFASLEAQ